MSSTQSHESRRPRAFAFLMVVIVGSMWWMADARSTIERATVEAAEYGRPLPTSFAVHAAAMGGDDALVTFEDDGPRHGVGVTSMLYPDGEEWPLGYESL